MVYHHRGLRVCTGHNQQGHERHIYWKLILSVFILLKYCSKKNWKKSNLNLAPISIKAKLNINIDANFVFFESCCCLLGKFIRSDLRLENVSQTNYRVSHSHRGTRFVLHFKSKKSAMKNFPTLGKKAPAESVTRLFENILV